MRMIEALPTRLQMAIVRPMVALALAAALVPAWVAPASADFISENTTIDPITGAITSTVVTTTFTTTTVTTDPTTGARTTTNTDPILDPLHGYCSVGCIDNGTNSPTTQNPITGFGFTVSPVGPKTGDLVVDVLVPNKGPLPPASFFNITG